MVVVICYGLTMNVKCKFNRIKVDCSTSVLLGPLTIQTRHSLSRQLAIISHQSSAKNQRWQRTKCNHSSKLRLVCKLNQSKSHGVISKVCFNTFELDSFPRPTSQG